MRRSGKSRRLWALLPPLLLALLQPGVEPHALAQTQGQSRNINGHVVSGRFLEEWSRQGSDQGDVYVNGLPITDAHPEVSLTDGKSYITQWFERARFEAHPENSAPYDLLLGLLGVSLAEGRGALDPDSRLVRDPADAAFGRITRPPDAGNTRLFFPLTGHAISGKVLEYWSKYGGLKQFGYPLSEPFSELSATDNKPYTVQYFERNRFELHPEKAAPYEVELGLLGVQQYKLVPVAASTLPVSPLSGIFSSRDTAVIASSQEPASLYSLAPTSPVELAILDALDNELFGVDQNGNYFPEDAYYLPTLENGGSYYVGSGDDRHLVTRYKIRRGIKWSDGQELTASDILFSYKLLMDPATTLPDRARWQKIYSVDAPSKYTVVYNWLSARQADDMAKHAPAGTSYPFLQPFIDEHRPVTDPLYFAVATIHPQHTLADMAAANIANSGYAHIDHVGTGPYKVERWVATDELDLVRNDNYTLTAPALLKRIVVRFISDPVELTSLLHTGDLDGALPDAFPVPVSSLDGLRPSQVVDYVPGLRWERIDFDVKYAPFSERAVREAVITGIDRRKIIDTVLRSKAPLLNVPLPPSSWVSLQNPPFAARWGGQYKLPIYNYDSARAGSLLDAAGWKIGPDGVRTKGDRRIDFYLAYNGVDDPLAGAIAGVVQTNLKAIGISAQPTKISTPCLGPGCTGQQCQLCIINTTEGPDPDFSRWSTPATQADAGRSIYGMKYTRYSTPDLDAPIRVFGSETGRDKREPLGAQIETRLMSDVATAPLFARPNINVHKADLVNWKSSAGSVTPFFNVAQWYFK
ncbi:MAG: peptide ABC transporter substrate-binding protein [Chloroflexota bacterium]|nr:peptide ABC transporter substrate-binding protein [Chloroflexota bacterium]